MCIYITQTQTPLPGKGRLLQGRWRGRASAPMLLMKSVSDSMTQVLAIARSSLSLASFVPATGSPGTVECGRPNEVWVGIAIWWRHTIRVSIWQLLKPNGRHPSWLRGVPTAIVVFELY